MKVSTFFKVLNNKINKYNKAAINPFTNPQPIVLVWVEEVPKDKNDNFNQQ